LKGEYTDKSGIRRLGVSISRGFIGGIEKRVWRRR